MAGDQLTDTPDAPARSTVALLGVHGEQRCEGHPTQSVARADKMLSFKLFDNWACEGSYVVIEMNDRKFTKTTKDYEPDQGECGTPEFVEGNLIGEHKDDMSFEDVVLWFCDHQPVFCRDYALCQLIEHYVAQRDGYNDAQAKKDALRDAARKERVRLRAIAKAEAKLVQLKAGV